MNLYIEIENGAAKNHPAFEDNLIQGFGSVPEHWEAFTRVERPVPTTYQIFDAEEPTYEKVNGVWTDVWSLRDMTSQEIATQQQATRDAFNSREQAENWSAWTLDEATCTMVPPIPRPALVEGKFVFWCGADANWKEAPACSIDINQCKFDFIAWDWVAV